MIPVLVRAVTRDGRVVSWQNAIGALLGQRGTYTFATEDDAIKFAQYAVGENAPSLHPDDLADRDIPEPVERIDR